MFKNTGHLKYASQSYRKIKLIFLFAALLLLVLSVFSYNRLNKLSSSAEQVTHTNLVKLELERALISLVELQNFQRGYLLTHDSIFLKSFYNAKSKYSISFAKLSNLISNDDLQKGKFIELKKIADERVIFMESLMDKSRVSTLLVSDIIEGKKAMDTARKKAELMMQREDVVLKSRTDDFYENTYITPVVTFVIIIAALVLLIFSYIKITDELGVSQKLQRQLALQNNELESINKELKSFAYVSSHDLQEPLRKIQTFADRLMLLESQRLSDKGKMYLEKMNASASRMQRLIEDLLNYAQSTSAVDVFETIQMKSILNDVLKEMEDELKQKNASVKAGALGVATIIPYQIRQLLSNLINNSIKFARPGIPSQIIISSTTEAYQDIKGLPEILKGGVYYHLCYQDNGIGFSPGYNEKIFEVFQRLHSKTAFKGTGIGLAICKKIVENHKGVITAAGKENEGARFDIYIPVR